LKKERDVRSKYKLPCQIVFLQKDILKKVSC
jgi:hypothetical protein